MAATIRKRLGIEVDEVAGGYGEFTVLVDGAPIRRGNPYATSLSILMSPAKLIEAVRERLAARG